MRFIAIVAVLGAFGAALYFSGDALEAWESPEPSKASLPVPETKRKTKPKRHAQPATKIKAARPAATPRKPAWLSELNSLCRHGRIELEAISRPSQLSGIVPYLRQAGRLNRRLNDRGLALVRRSGNATMASELQELFDRDEAAVQRMLTLAEKGQYQQLARFAQSLVPLARAENRVLKRLGAVDCTVSPDDYRL
ncbi:MAG: hypothetical protein ACRDNP_12470 [Gaiellaceae bacterium]|jgi:hypothetical protein